MTRPRSLGGIGSLLLLASLTACMAAGDEVSTAPYAKNLTWTAQESVQGTSNHYKAIEGEAVVESKGTIGGGSNCGTSTGTIVERTFLDREHRNHVVGNTVTDHPLNPGTDVFAKIGVSIVAEEITTTGSYERKEYFFEPNTDSREWDETEATDAGRQTAARYHGVAADEYIVSMFPLDLWISTNGATAQTPTSGTRQNSLTLLSRHNPKKGDSWTSVNNTTVYTYEGKEKLNVGGKGVQTDKVSVFSIETHPGGDVINTCLKVGPLEDTTTEDEQVSLLTEAVVLDVGCESRYQHRAIGTEWWYGDTLVKFEGVRNIVTISDHGWEWYEGGGDECVRRTSTTKPVDESAAKLFVEYVVTVEDSSYIVNSWDVVEAATESE